MENQTDLFWQRFAELAKESNGANAYDFYVKTAQLVSLTNNIATILLPDELRQQFWTNNLQSCILTAGFEVLDRQITAHYIFPNDVAEETIPIYQVTKSQTTLELNQLATQNLPPIQSDLNQNYQFSNFIQGEGNKWAKAACLAVADKPGKNYNPLFIWGGPGLGKTHLLNAVGNSIQEDNPTARILYITTENFINEYVTSTRLGKMDELREKFRHLDVLLIDDIQFLANKDSTQEEFFNIFNALYDKEKQIILTSDRPPKSLENLPERLVTRFGWDLTVDITPPDFETRVAILQDKISHYHFNFQNDALEYLANQVDSNVRDLEGALQNINLVANLEQTTTISVELVAQAIRSRTTQAPKMSVIPIETIQEEVGKFYGVTVKEIKSTKRPQNLAMARQVAIYLSRELTDNSTTKIGKAFGGRDHSTVLHAYNKIKNMIAQDSGLQIEINTIKNKLT